MKFVKKKPERYELMDEIQNMLELLGNPIPAARPRVTRFGNTFDPKHKQKKAAKIEIGLQWKEEPLDCPLSLDVAFHMPKPSSWSKKRKTSQEGAPHSKKPDTDNLIKFTLDVMSGIVFKDDSCVYNLKVIKFYSETPKTIIKVVK